MQSVQQNGSIYIHVYFTKSGFHPDPRQKALYRRLATVHMSRSKSALAAQIPSLGAGSLDTAVQSLSSQVHRACGNPEPREAGIDRPHVGPLWTPVAQMGGPWA